jgi:hypothetical protein
MVRRKQCAPTNPEESGLRGRRHMLSRREGMQYFEQAEIDGEVFVFHTWPVGAPDDTNPA